MNPMASRGDDGRKRARPFLGGVLRLSVVIGVVSPLSGQDTVAENRGVGADYSYSGEPTPGDNPVLFDPAWFPLGWNKARQCSPLLWSTEKEGMIGFIRVGNTQGENQ